MMEWIILDTVTLLIRDFDCFPLCQKKINTKYQNMSITMSLNYLWPLLFLTPSIACSTPS